MMYDINNCSLCPRNCQADRTKSNGVCRSGEMVRAARASLHYWEEPCISGTNGSGTIFLRKECLYLWIKNWKLKIYKYHSAHKGES